MDFSSYERLIITKYVGAQIEYPKMAISILSYWYLVLLVLFGLIGVGQQTNNISFMVSVALRGHFLKTTCKTKNVTF